MRRGWGYLTRVGFESDLRDELTADSRQVAEGVVLADARQVRTGLSAPIFARQAMRSPFAVAPEPDAVLDAVRRRCRPDPAKSEQAFAEHLQVVAPDGRDPEDPRRALAAELEAALRAELAGWNSAESDALMQVWVLSEEQVWVGRTELRDALSAQAGGRSRLKRPAEAVSRAGLKLEEALAWVGVGPDKGDRVADLGAAPGGWTQVLLDRGARVVAVDPKGLKVQASKGRLEHRRGSAFDFVPEEELDWVVCDMAWRPAEVARLLAKWGRRSWAQQFVANFKLPMKKKVDALCGVLRELESAGWQGLRGRHLFHDREEVTLYGWLDPAQARRPAQAPFRVRAQAKHETSSAPGPRKKTKKKKPRKTSIKRQHSNTPKGKL